MKNYRIDFGNSSTGPVGAVAYVTAPTKQAALTKFRRHIGDEGRELHLTADDGDTDTVIVYFNANKVTLKDVELED